MVLVSEKIPAASQEDAKVEEKADTSPTTNQTKPSMEEMHNYVSEIAKGNMNAKPPVFEEVTDPEFEELYRLMAESGVNDAQLRDAVASRKNNDYTEITPIGKYDPDFVRRVLIGHWDKILATIEERGEAYKDIPF